MKYDYWELSDRERSRISEEEMANYVAVELMKAGVVPARLDLMPEPVMPKPDSVVFRLRVGYRSDEIAYPTIEAAAVAAAGGVGVVETQSIGDYPHQVKVHTLKRFPEDRDELVERVPIYTPDRMAAVRSELERAAAARSHNATVEERYQAALKAQREAVRGLWEDWHLRQANARKVAEIGATLREYLRLTEGDQDMAWAFIRKAYTEDEVAMAREWSAEEWAAEREASK